MSTSSNLPPAYSLSQQYLTSALQRRVLLFQMPFFSLIIITESFRAWIYPHGRQLIWTLFPPQHTQMFWLSGSTHQNQINENMDKNIWISKKSSKNSKKNKIKISNYQLFHFSLSMDDSQPMKCVILPFSSLYLMWRMHSATRFNALLNHSSL